MLDFKSFLIEQNTVGKHNDYAGAAWQTSDVTGSEANRTMAYTGRPTFAPSMDIVLPSTTKTGRVTLIERNKNPILVVLEDNTKLWLSRGQFERIKGPEPTKGSRLTIVFQRHPNDRSNSPSKIESILSH